MHYTYKPHKTKCQCVYRNAQLQYYIHKDILNPLHLEKDDLLQHRMNHKIFPSYYKCIDHILRAPVKVRVAVNLRNFSSVLLFLFRCHGRKEILLIRKTRRTTGRYLDQTTFSWLEQPQEGSPWKQAGVYVCHFHLPFEWGSTACFAWPLWVTWVQTACWHTYPVRFSCAKEQSEVAHAAFVLLNSSVS